MKKHAVLALALGGGLILLTLLLSDTTTTDEAMLTEEAETATLPVAVRSQFPTYPAAVVVNSQQTDNDEGTTFYSLSLSTDHSITQINDWYREALSHGGWSIKSDKNLGGYQIIQAEKANLYTSVQAATAEDGSVTISQQAQIRP